MTMTRLLQGVVLVLLVWAGLWLAGWLFWGATVWAVAVALSILCLHAPVMAVEFALLRWANRNDPAPRAGALELLRAWFAEVLSAVVVFGWRQPWRSRRFEDDLGSHDPGRRGVILVHGFVCNRGLWNPWLRRLHALGVPCIALDLEPAFGSIDRYPPLIEDAVRRMTETTGQPPLLVAHSMGGLAVRAWLRDFSGDRRIHGVVTIGSPHRGTWLARFGYSPNAREMQLDGRWMRALAAAEPPERHRRFTCFYSHCDNIVFPASTATLPGADNRHLRGTAHVHLVQHPAVFDAVLCRLRDDDADDPPKANPHAPGCTATASIPDMARNSA
jgi:triacylglycerol lipase